jgi:branched-chain amino acid transport system substrate-binding protein
LKISFRSTVGALAAGALALGGLVAFGAPAQAAMPKGCKALTLGFFGALTGDAGNLGKNISQGAKLSVLQYGASKPKVKVNFVSFDSQGDPAQAPALAQSAIKNKCA